MHVQYVWYTVILTFATGGKYADTRDWIYEQQSTTVDLNKITASNWKITEFRNEKTKISKNSLVTLDRLSKAKSYLEPESSDGKVWQFKSILRVVDGTDCWW